MTIPRLKIAWSLIAKVFAGTMMFMVFLVMFGGIYVLGIIQGYSLGQTDARGQLVSFLSQLTSEVAPTPTNVPTPTSSQQQNVSQPSADWGGPDLWKAVNERRLNFGVNPLNQRDELCTIASIRLNELLALGDLDAHKGFSSLEEDRSDLDWIFEKYGTVAEFLQLGADDPQEAVSLWENTLGHSKLLTGGEYVWGCIYAQSSYAVAIAAF